MTLAEVISWARPRTRSVPLPPPPPARFQLVVAPGVPPGALAWIEQMRPDWQVVVSPECPSGLAYLRGAR